MLSPFGTTNCNFTNNAAKYGGAVYTGFIINDKNVYEYSSGTVTNCNFINNKASYDGGAIDFDGSGNVVNCNFTDCSAKYGGAVFGGDGYGSNNGIINCTFNGCSALRSGNNIYLKMFTSLITSDVSMYYNDAKYLVVKVRDSNRKVISGAQVTIKLNGVTKSLKTDANGQVKLLINLAPNSYKATITFPEFTKSGNNAVYYAEQSASAKVTVKKATPKLTAKAKTFKINDKTKKYTITLKDNINKAIKNTKVTLKVNGKTYSAKTNSKGVATFKLTKLAKKGKFTAVVKFAGNKYYNAKTVKPKITVK